ncbi:glycoside hydrolase family 30 protein [Puia dinghuensis]|uniref:Glucosylceramidase n=1 Tax=Puia dinghuensis TaxID=1792502 RepID=A0A8J2U7C4_9BACT|nr:glycoside hydrolase family 30 beta sandwich domain-containing protein [Puia dinghuensis]GGA84086.1 glucosylceramidase [Puia dinghuensis]
MISVLRTALTGAVLSCTLGTVYAQKDKQVTIWLTDASQSVFFQQQADGQLEKGSSFPSDPVIAIDEKKTFQHVDGFGWALTGGSAQHIMQMSPAARTALLKELFTTDSNHIGGSYLRVSIGASDLSDHVFSYDDLPAGQTDTALTHFDLGPDKKDVIPVLQQIIQVNPEIKILGSPWSAPAWMKNNHDTRGGSLLPQYYSVYANYLVKYILQMQQQGIGIDALTVQNEPLHPGNNPSMYMPAAAEAAFVKLLGPAIDRERLDTKIIVYDHNADRPDYPDSIYHDPGAAKWVDGAAFHLYGGKIEALTPLHDSFPDKNLYFTEQWVGAPGDFAKDIPEHVDKLIVGAMRNWCKTVIEWNLAANSKWEPHTDRGGCDRCLGAVTIDGDVVKRNPAYYIIAHAAKYVRPGSSRIVSNSDETLPNVAFRTPTGQAVLVVLNNTAAQKGFTIELRGKRLHTTLNGGAVATYVFQL